MLCTRGEVENVVETTLSFECNKEISSKIFGILAGDRRVRLYTTVSIERKTKIMIYTCKYGL